MKYPFSRAAVLWTATLVVLPLLFAVHASAQSGPREELKVGTFTRAYLVQAYYTSDAWKQKVAELMAKRNKAALASDSDTVDQLDNQLRAMQTLAQRQMSGQAPLTNIYEALQDQWPAIAKEAGVDVIVASPLFVAPNAAIKDVTAIVVRHLAGHG